MPKDFILKINNHLINFSKIKAGIKNRDINPKFINIFNAMDFEEEGKNELSDNELKTFFGYVQKEAEKHNSTSLGNKEYKKLVKILSDQGYDLENISKEEFLEFLLSLSIADHKAVIENEAPEEKKDSVIEEEQVPSSDEAVVEAEQEEVSEAPVTVEPEEDNDNKVKAEDAQEAEKIQEERKSDTKVDKKVQPKTEKREKVQQDKKENNTKIIVQVGETLYALASKFGCSIEELKEVNKEKLVKGKWFRAGDEITIPREVAPELLEGRKNKEEVYAEYTELMRRKKAERIQEDNEESSTSVNHKPAAKKTNKKSGNTVVKREKTQQKPVSKQGETTTASNRTKKKADFWKDNKKKGKTWDYVSQNIKGKVTPRQVAKDLYKKEGINPTSKEIDERAQFIADTCNNGDKDKPLKNNTYRFRTTKEYSNQVKAKSYQKQGSSISNAIYNDIKGLGTGSTFEANLKKVNKDNVVNVIQEYTKHGESLMSAITGEIFVKFNKKTGKGAHYECAVYLFNCLIEKAKESHIDKTRINQITEDFNKACYSKVVHSDLYGASRSYSTDVAKIDHIFNTLISLINTKKSVTEADKAQIKADATKPMLLPRKTANLMAKMHTQARQALNIQDKNDGWAANLWGTIKDSLNTSMSRKQMISSLNDLKDKIENLRNSKTEQEFRDKFKQYFGVEYNPEFVQACSNYQEKLVGVEATHAVEESFNRHCAVLLSQTKLLQGHKSNMDGYDPSSSSKNEVFEQGFNSLAEFVGAGDINKGKEELNQYISYAKTLDEKWEILGNIARRYQNELHKNTMEATGGISYDAFKSESAGSYRAAFGSKGDIMQKINEYSASQQAGAAIAKGTVKIGGTVLLSLIPGVGAVAAVAIAGGVSLATDLSDEVSKEAVSIKDLANDTDKLKSILSEAGVNAAFVGQGAILTKIINAKSFLKLPGAKFLAGSDARKVATSVIADTGMGAGVEYAQTGEVTIGGVAFYAVFSSAGHLVALKAKKSKPKTEKTSVPKEEPKENVIINSNKEVEVVPQEKAASKAQTLDFKSRFEKSQFKRTTSNTPNKLGGQKLQQLEKELDDLCKSAETVSDIELLETRLNNIKTNPNWVQKMRAKLAARKAELPQAKTPDTPVNSEPKIKEEPKPIEEKVQSVEPEVKKTDTQEAAEKPVEDSTVKEADKQLRTTTDILSRTDGTPLGAEDVAVIQKEVEQIINANIPDSDKLRFLKIIDNATETHKNNPAVAALRENLQKNISTMEEKAAVQIKDRAEAKAKAEAEAKAKAKAKAEEEAKAKAEARAEAEPEPEPIEEKLQSAEPEVKKTDTQEAAEKPVEESTVKEADNHARTTTDILSRTDGTPLGAEDVAVIQKEVEQIINANIPDSDKLRFLRIIDNATETHKNNPAVAALRENLQKNISSMEEKAAVQIKDRADARAKAEAEAKEASEIEAQMEKYETMSKDELIAEWDRLNEKYQSEWNVQQERIYNILINKYGLKPVVVINSNGGKTEWQPIKKTDANGDIKPKVIADDKFSTKTKKPSKVKRTITKIKRAVTGKTPQKVWKEHYEKMSNDELLKEYNNLYDKSRTRDGKGIRFETIEKELDARGYGLEKIRQVRIEDNQIYHFELRPKNLVSATSAIGLNDVVCVPNKAVKVSTNSTIRLGNQVDISLKDIESRLKNLKEGAAIIIGREGNIQINNDYVSELHIKIEKYKGEIYVTDLGSKNGTIINTTKPDCVAKWSPSLKDDVLYKTTGEYVDMIEAKYKNLRESEYRYDDSVNPNISDDDLAFFYQNNYINVEPMGYWALRVVPGKKVLNPVDRISLNVKADKNMLFELDRLIAKGEYVNKEGKTVKIKIPNCEYKTPPNLEEWCTRHDPITMYFSSKLSPDAAAAIAEITEKYARTPSNGKALMNALDGKPWIAHEEYVPVSKARALYFEARILNADLGRAVGHKLHMADGFNTSTGAYAAAKMLVDEYKMAVKIAK